MALYFFHLKNHSDALLDAEGREIADGKIAAAALAEAREIISADVRSGSVDLDQNIEVEDSNGKVVHRISLDDAVTINRPSSP